MSSLAIISLISLSLVVIIGFVKKVNIGFLAIGVAYLIGSIGGMSDKEIINGFNESLFITLVGVTLLFGIASANGTIELLSKKIIALVGSKTFLIPIIIFLMALTLSAIGPGHIAIGILMTTFAVFLAIEMNINPFSTALLAKLGANAGCASPISPTGIIGYNLSEPLGYSGFSAQLFFAPFIEETLFAIIIFFAFKAYKVKSENPIKWHLLEPFTSKQRLTLCVITVLIIACISFKLNVGLSAFLGASILVISKSVDEKKAIQQIPWGTLLLITGIGILINVVTKFGGIELISNYLISHMNEKTAVPIISATSGILSWVSSTTGVVMPTMFPIAAEVTQSFQGSVSYSELISGVTATSFAAAISPLSTGGAIIISAYATAKKISIKEQNRLFKLLFLLSFASVSFSVFLSAIGMYSLPIFK